MNRAGHNIINGIVVTEDPVEVLHPEHTPTCPEGCRLMAVTKNGVVMIPMELIREMER